MADSAAGTDGAALRSVFLTALGVEPDRSQEELLQQELEWFAHPRVRAVAARMEPVDTLVEFLATTRLTLPGDASAAFRAELTDLTERSAVGGPGADVPGSPRDFVTGRIEELFGAPATALADRLDRLISYCGGTEQALDSVTLRRLYAEALDLCDVWSTALREGLDREFEPLGTADEVYATEAALLGSFDPGDPTDLAWRRLDLADCVRQLTELMALDQCGLLPGRWMWDETPSLGWSVVLAQFQYRLRQISAVGAPARVAGGPGGGPATGGNRCHGEALHLLAALDGGGSGPTVTGPTREEAEVGHQRIRRSLRPAMPWATRLQAADLAQALRRRPELMTAHGLGPVEAAQQTADLLPGLADCLRYLGPGPGPDRLALSAWELRELFPELCRLLTCYHDQLAHGDLGAYRESQSPEILQAVVVGACLESCGGSGRFAAALSGELAAFGLLFPGDEAVDRALGLLGEQPRDTRPGHPWWDDLTWHAWLRAAAAQVMWHARQGSDRTGDSR